MVEQTFKMQAGQNIFMKDITIVACKICPTKISYGKLSNTQNIIKMGAIHNLLTVIIYHLYACVLGGEHTHIPTLHIQETMKQEEG